MPGNSPLIDASCIAVLVLLVARSALRLGRDRWRPAGRGGDCRPHHRGGEAAHLAMAVGMALMFLPVPAARPALAVLFGAVVLFAASVWVTDQVRSVRARRLRSGRGRPSEHRLEPHHVIVGSAMVVMALRSRTAVGMAAMPGMAAGAGAGAMPGVVWLTLFGYVWLSVLVLGGGLARAFLAEAGEETGSGLGSEPGAGTRSLDLGALLGAPSTIYACELAMTVVMGLMLLS